MHTNDGDGEEDADEGVDQSEPPAAEEQPQQIAQGEMVLRRRCLLGGLDGI